MRLISFVAILMIAGHALAGSVTPKDGWAVHATPHAYEDLIDRLKTAVKANGMIVVTQAGPTQAARTRGIEIPGNRVLGVYNNDFAVRALGFSVRAMIEAPIRFYVTEDPDGSATLSYKAPSHVFAPYLDEGGDGLAALAAELDTIFAAIAEDAIAP